MLRLNRATWVGGVFLEYRQQHGLVTYAWNKENNKDRCRVLRAQKATFRMGDVCMA